MRGGIDIHNLLWYTEKGCSIEQIGEAEHAGINVSRVLQEALMSVLKVERNERTR